MRKRLIFRVDDVGYTEAYDMGINIVFDKGIGSAADIMFDAKHVIDEMKILKDKPWLSFGWHRHLWESPVLGKEVPSMIDEEGRFKWRHRFNERKKEATYEDAYREFDAQMKLCYEYLGRYPDVASLMNTGLPMDEAYNDVVKKYGIAYNVFSTDSTFPFARQADDKWKDRNIISVNIQPGKDGFDLKKFDEYDPLKKMMSVEWTDKEEIYFYGWHPGFCDAYIMAESRCNLHRCKEHEAAVSDTFRQWIIDNRIELINFRDALYGTNEFQNHLKEINSDLYVL
ncbi:MAG: ChbG/HpnK family deacetylase [Erysipelotrichaceae bacterium]|nr:ChbG/HpnK family deacetylase [Erysipelotrichaceae bacterium]